MVCIWQNCVEKKPSLNDNYSVLFVKTLPFFWYLLYQYQTNDEMILPIWRLNSNFVRSISKSVCEWSFTSVKNQFICFSLSTFKMVQLQLSKFMHDFWKLVHSNSWVFCFFFLKILSIIFGMRGEGESEWESWATDIMSFGMNELPCLDRIFKSLVRFVREYELVQKKKRCAIKLNFNGNVDSANVSFAKWNVQFR